MKLNKKVCQMCAGGGSMYAKMQSISKEDTIYGTGRRGTVSFEERDTLMHTPASWLVIDDEMWRWEKVWCVRLDAYVSFEGAINVCPKYAQHLVAFVLEQDK